MRLVTDYRHLNKNISRAHHFFLSVSDIKKRIRPDTKYFIKLDLTSLYHQLKIDKAHRDLTTFAIGEGRYKFKRAAMGLSASSDSFCRRSDRVFQGLPVVKLVDDLLVEGRSKDDAVKKLGRVLKTCHKNGVVISPNKMESGTVVKFCGFQLAVRDGKPSIEADPDKCDALRKMRTPENKQEVRQFLGMCAQLAAWSPDFTHTTTHLRALTEKDRAFVWSSESDSEFETLKQNLGNPKNLSVFDKNLKTELLVDASILHGLAFILTQLCEDGSRKIITMGSRTLSKGDKNYSIFEIEAQSIIFALNQCSFYLRGAEHFVVRSDHKALCGIESRIFSEVTNTRVLKLMEMCSVYSFSVEHIQGKMNTVADCLSRMPLWSGVEELGQEPDMVRSVRSIISREDTGLEEMKRVASEDEEYKLLLEAFKSRKPLTEICDNHPARKFASIWDRVSMMDGETDQPLLVVDNQRIGRKPGTRRIKGSALARQKDSLMTWINHRRKVEMME